jgi:hypothetical protein
VDMVVINCEGLLCGHGCFWPQEMCDGCPCHTSADVHAAGFEENHRLSPVIKCAEKFLYIYI